MLVSRSMNVKINDLMAKSVIVAHPHTTVEHLRALMFEHSISAIPIQGPDAEPVGIVTSTDLAAPDVRAGSPASLHMSSPVYKVPAYNDASVAARIMIDHRCHHVIVTHEGRLEGIISSFDLLQLVADRRFVAKNAPPARSKQQHR